MRHFNPSLTLTAEQARHFILAYQGLLTNRRFEGKQGILAFVRRVGCLQFDPLNVVGYNQQLVLQSRVPGFRPEMLEELLYEDRELIDGWDKNMSIYLREDWPCFSRIRNAAKIRLEDKPHLKKVVPQVMERLQAEGPLSSADLEYDEVVDWSWAPTRLARAVLESMYFIGDLLIHHKARTRKVYDLASRLLPADCLMAPDPNPSQDSYWEWYVLRRVGAIGMLWNKSGDAWLGISGMKSSVRNDAFQRLKDMGRLIEVQVEGIEPPFYIRSEDVPLLQEVIRWKKDDVPARAFVLAPLDNMLWDRKLIKLLFAFDYRWEVYKPAAERQFGYYVLPVMCEDRFVGRFEPGMDKKNKQLVIKNWWWEPEVPKTERLFGLLRECFEQFMHFTGAKSVRLEEPLTSEEQSGLDWLSPLTR
ncbi:winged helix-turn-helix domain-containing protein [Paenibacillus hamazuiensis]|uniref:winged helix-turn-helix domain-containing protein n=1 Tax=Paenibacillus hamazuiensis TaxID=2936508 RepID=UPI0020107DBD|nr:crosslink repair DNA glycosylase YcaQ family protein [Paenibacillus hamazuiensis]